MFRTRTYKYRFDEWGFEKNFNRRKAEARLRAGARMRGSVRLSVDVYNEERINLGSSTLGLNLKDPAKEV
jgi:hypothetical protein